MKMKVDIKEIRFETGASIYVNESTELHNLELRSRHVEFIEPVHLDIQITNTGDKYLVMGKLTAKTRVECDRCLEQFILPMNIEFYHELERDELGDENEIDLTDAIYENLLLEQPIKVLCSEDCKGLCPQCGQNLNAKDCGCDREVIDPRLVKLKEFFKQD